jgi:putative FmdB family regulatory protein
MPFYEYQCKNCGHDLEAMQKISDAPLKRCPHCGKSQLQRLMSAPVFRLKGGGWYETDFKNDKDNKRNLADRPEASEEKSKDGGKDGDTSEAKPEAAKEATATEAASKDKAPDKPADKAASDVKKPDTGKSAPPARSTARGKSAAKRTVKKPAAKVRRRR